MSGLDVDVREALDRQVPLRAERAPDWRDVTRRAARQRRVRGRRVLAVVALAAALVAVASALAATGRGPFGEISSWLNGEPGEPASPSEQAGFAERSGASYVGFPAGTKLRRLAQTYAGGKTYTLLGFTSDRSLCLRLVEAALPAARGSNECVTRAELDSSPAPALVATEAWLPNGASAGSVDGIYGFADDTVQAIEVRRGGGEWKRVPVASNVFLALDARRPGGPFDGIVNVRAITRDGDRVAVPFVASTPLFGLGSAADGTYVTHGQQVFPGPQHTAAHYTGGTIAWLVGHEKRGQAWTPPPQPAGAPRRRDPVVFARAIQPDPGSPLRVGVFLIRTQADSQMGTKPGSLTVCMSRLEPLVDTSGWSCKPNRAGRLLFLRESFALDYGGGPAQQRTLLGVASDDVSFLRLHLASGRVVPAALHDNVFSVTAPYAQFPATLAAYDARGRVIGLARQPGPPHATPCPSLEVWPESRLPETRPYQRLDLGALTLDGAPILGRTPAEVEAALGTPDVATTKALHNRSPEQRFFYGGTRPSGAEVVVEFTLRDGELRATRLAFHGRGLVDARLGRVLNTDPDELRKAILATYGRDLGLSADTRPLVAAPCGSALRGKKASIQLGVEPWQRAWPYLTIDGPRSPR